ncbi:D-hexose-6-phosphate mutarotase [Actinomyces polynesiensis]|uniref:D-hexose-6-phosphate mutarotase n=1 Tax=Actinomyces polynesiensis TaxID=1325934 RepID=UPI000695056A|nr:D-hexose-6-phosphate mutarotase [Actinomyces polynesiensis]
MTILEDQVLLDGPGGTATVIPFGAQVLEWAPTGESPVLWRSSSAVLDGSAPVRGGIPVCLPWFGRGRTGDLAPSHGFARTTEWTPLGVGSGHEPQATFLLEHDPAGDPGTFPHCLRALLRVAITEDLVVSLTVTNTGDHTYDFEEALHTYFAVGDVKDVTLDGLEGADYQDKVRGGDLWRSQVGEVAFVRETDRVYRSDSTVVLHDPRRRRDITIDKDGSADTVVWNPWVDRAAALPDLGDPEWQDFVCVEAANIGDDAITLEPGEEHSMVLVIHVDPMA